MRTSITTSNSASALTTTDQSKHKPGRLRHSAGWFLAAWLITSGNAGATSLGYILDQSNSLPDNKDYLEVMIDGDSGDAINFSVTPINPVADYPNRQFGVQFFGFNVDDGITADASNVTGLPDGWRAKDNRRAAGFGKFDIVVFGRGSNRQKELTFSITGVDNDSPEDYVESSSGNARQGNTFFSARVKGAQPRVVDLDGPTSINSRADLERMPGKAITMQSAMAEAKGKTTNLKNLFGNPQSTWKSGQMMKLIEHMETSNDLADFMNTPEYKRFKQMAFFGGSQEVQQAVPIPAAGWLFVSAIGGLVAFRKRHAKTAAD